MKRIILLSILFFGSLCASAQTSEYEYKIKIAFIKDPGTAKGVPDLLRDKFIAYPTFNDTLDVFHFMSNRNVRKTKLDSLLIQNGQALVSFSKNMKTIFIKAEIKTSK